MPASQVPDRGGPHAAGAERVLEVLRRLCEYPHGVTLDELSRALDEPKSSVHRALATLGRAGFSERASGNRYRLSLEFVRLGLTFYEAWDEHTFIRPALDAMVQATGEAAHFAYLDGSEIVYVAKVSPPAPGIHMTSVVGGRNPAHCTGLGKALLAYELTSLSQVREYVEKYGPLQKRTPNTITTASALDTDLSLVRQRGYATDCEESEPGVNCIAIPVFLASPSHPRGAVSVSALARRMSASDLVAVVDKLRELVQHLNPADSGT